MLAEAGIILTDDEDELVQNEAEEEEGTTKNVERVQDFTVEKLNEMLNEALTAEDYERAAQIRDEINRRS